jgi:hypothetical protein
MSQINSAYILSASGTASSQYDQTGNSTTLKQEYDIEDLLRRVNRIEYALGIIQRDTDLENQYPELKQAGDCYNSAISTAIVDLKQLTSAESDKYTALADNCKVMEKLKHNNEPG